MVHKAGPYNTSIVHEASFPIPVSPGIGQVLVRVSAAGLAFPDLLTAEDRHVHPLGKLPRIMGREIAGVVIKLGLGVSKLKLGDWVFGSSVSGAWASFAVVAENEVQLFTPSPRFNPTIAAGFSLNYGTSFHAVVHQAQLGPGETILILGAAGGIGLAAIDIAKALGATVIACASSQDKLKVCKDAGADFVVDYTSPDSMRSQVEKITGGKAATSPLEKGGVDVVFDCVGGEWTEKALRLVRFGGRFLVLGFASGSNNPKSSIPSVPFNLILLNERKVLGVLYGTWRKLNPRAEQSAMETMIGWMEKGILKPLVRVYPLDEYKQAMDDLMGRRSVGKLVFDFEALRARI